MSSTLYPTDSVFTVEMYPKARPGWVDYEPNKQVYDVAVVEFNDDGMCVDKRQVGSAVDHIRQVRTSTANGNGAVVVLFIHGWHHDARWDIETNEGDSHFAEFREVLYGLCIREAERYYGEVTGRRVIGIYFGWNGDPPGSWLAKSKLTTSLTFWNRYRAATRISSCEDIKNAVREIITATKEPIDSRPESPLIMVGHSMGALMLESAFLSLLRDRDKPLLRYRDPSDDRCVDTQHNGKSIYFPDVLVAINSAADSAVVKEIRKELHDQRFTKTLTTPTISYSPPLLVSVTSTADYATRFIWRISQFPRFWRKTDGHDPSLFTHTFKATDASVKCNPRQGPDSGQNWHCLRPPIPDEIPTPSLVIDLPEVDRRVNGTATHTQYRIEPCVDENQAYPVWTFQAMPKLIQDHNDIFNFRSATLILALIQVSGAVMSLAQEVKDSFEPYSG